MKDIPDAAIAPAITAGHWRNAVEASDAAIVGGTPVALISTEPEEGQNGDDDDDKANQINDAVHWGLPLLMPGGNGPAPRWFPRRLCGYRCGKQLFSRPINQADSMSRALIVAGALLIAAGLAWPWLTGIGLGRLPGDVVLHRGNTTFYFPVVTCIVVSVVLSLLVWIFKR